MKDEFEVRAQLAKALANSARLRILDALSRQPEMCVGQLVELVGLDQTTVSKHLAVLRGVGLVQNRKEGL